MRPALLLLIAGLAVAGCDASEPVDSVPVSCEALGAAEAGTLTARLGEGTVTYAIQPRCLRATVANGRVVVRAVLLSGALNEGEIVLTALSTDPGVYLVTGLASARFVRRGVVYEAVEGSVVLVGVTETQITGTFDFSTASGLSVTAGEFSIPRG